MPKLSWYMVVLARGSRSGSHCVVSVVGACKNIAQTIPFWNANFTLKGVVVLHLHEQLCKILHWEENDSNPRGTTGVNLNQFYSFQYDKLIIITIIIIIKLPVLLLFYHLQANVHVEP